LSEYRTSLTELTLGLDDDLRAELDAICELADGSLDRAGALIAAARRGLPELRKEADVHAARSVKRCPRCGHIGLTPRDENGARLQACIECGGVWLDDASLQRVFASPTAEIATLARRVDENARSVHDSTPEIACSVCTTRLVRHREPNSRIQVDTCKRHGSWFDRGELAKFVVVVAERRRQLAELELAGVEAAAADTHEWFRDLHQK
jgi:Zn-finger nucleic acid-binding protein